MIRRMTAIDEEGRVQFITDDDMSLSQMQEAVGGLIEYVPRVPEDAWMPVNHEGRILRAKVVEVIVNEEGRLMRQPPNHIATLAAFGEIRYLHAVMQGPDHLLVGRAIIVCEVDPEADEVTFDEFLQVGEAAQEIIRAKIAGANQSLYPMWGNYE
tara:strand:+ start:156 stop:620 length:465 start_codon:yes stop_codon:yes gene_type:complete